MNWTNTNRLAATICAAASLAFSQSPDKQPADSTGAAGRQSSGARSGNSALMGGDHDFVMKATESGNKEVELSQMALSKASSQQVKDFAQMMVTDHTNANQELTSLVSQRGWSTPALSASMTKDRMTNAVNGKSGMDFDRAYMKEMVADHEKAVALFKKAGNNAKDSELKAFASKTLPTLQQHLTQARSLSQTNGSGKSATSTKTSNNP